jgi:hypothetical protein
VIRSLVFSTLAILVLSLASTGCSQSDNNPKAPENSPTLKKMTPSGGGGGKRAIPGQQNKSE